MKATELREGNHVHYNGEECEILCVGFGNVTIYPKPVGHRLNISTEKITPIPLTEEWLVKFGFNEVENNWMAYGGHFPCALIFDPKGICMLSIEDNDEPIYIRHIQHVH